MNEKAQKTVAGVLVFVVFFVIASGFVLASVGLVWWAVSLVGSTPAVFLMSGLTVLAVGIGLLLLLGKIARWATSSGEGS